MFKSRQRCLRKPYTKAVTTAAYRYVPMSLTTRPCHWLQVVRASPGIVTTNTLVQFARFPKGNSFQLSVWGTGAVRRGGESIH